MNSEIKNPGAEIEAMKGIAEIIKDLDEDARARVMQWTCSHFGIKISGDKAANPRQRNPKVDVDDDPTLTEFDAFADLYSAVSPKSDSERALVGCYWLQELQDAGEIESQTVNTLLKDLGHGVSNITRALTDLKGKKPQLVLQTRKSGKAKQARKKYKITGAGIKVIQQMIAGEGDEA